MVKVDENACTGCEVCVESCPMDVLRMDEVKGKAYPAFLEDCQICFLCQMDCPREAISVSAR